MEAIACQDGDTQGDGNSSHSGTGLRWQVVGQMVGGPVTPALSKTPFPFSPRTPNDSGLAKVNQWKDIPGIGQSRNKKDQRQARPIFWPVSFSSHGLGLSWTTKPWRKRCFPTSLRSETQQVNVGVPPGGHPAACAAWRMPWEDSWGEESTEPFTWS